MSGDLVGGGYPLANPIWSCLTGQLSNALQSNEPARSNVEYLGLSTVTDGALAATGVGCFVAVPVDPGTVISKVLVPIGATAAGTPTNQFVALYSGTNVAAPPLIAQSTDTTTAAIPASAVASWSLTTPKLITPAMAPNGFIYVEIAITATTVPTAMGVSVPTAVGYQLFGTGTTPVGASPKWLAATAGSALAGTAAATIVSGAAKAVAPIVFLI